MSDSGSLVHADIVAIDQLIVYNRFGSFDPYGMVYALQRDVTEVSDGDSGSIKKARDCGKHTGAEAGSGKLVAGKVRLKDCLRPRPLVLRARVGDIFQVHFTNLLRPAQPDISKTFCELEKRKNQQPTLRDLRDLVSEEPSKGFGEPFCNKLKEGSKLEKTQPGKDADWPFTRQLSFVIPGLELVEEKRDGKISRAGVCRGTSVIAPNESVTCVYKLSQEGTHLFQSLAAAVGGEGDGGSLTHGLFGALIVEPKASMFYRSQVSHKGFEKAWPALRASGQSPHTRDGNINFEATDDRVETVPQALPSTDNPCRAEAAGYSKAVPVLNMMRKCSDAVVTRHGRTLKGSYELVHGDINAVVVTGETKDYGKSSQSAGPFREFVVIFHDELKTFYTRHFEELEKFGQFSGIRDGFAINYGASGAGSIVLANRKKIGPARDCPECLYEEFFLESWANGDPALLESFPADPSNVHHSYLNDRVVFRNFHAGPKETHVFHLHAHQWFTGNDENRSAYLDSQTIGPQQGMSYNIYQGGMSVYRKGPAQKKGGFWDTLGSGNRNRTPGDSIFHCHLYPHFAQGMWELWRTHDVLEDGTRTLPDGQVEERLSVGGEMQGKRLGTKPDGTGPLLWFDPDADPATEGTPIPGLIPVPEQAAPLLASYDATTGFPGYPFYIAGEVGHRSPQAPMDIAVDVDNAGQKTLRSGGLGRHVVVKGERKDADHVKDSVTYPAANTVAQKLALGDMTAEFDYLELKLLPQNGTALEKRAMAFHHNGLLDQKDPAKMIKLKKFDGTDASVPGAQALTVGKPNPENLAYGSLPVSMKVDTSHISEFFPVNGAAAKPGAPFADPCAVPDALRKAEMTDPYDVKNAADPNRRHGTVRPFPYWDHVASGPDRSQEQSGNFGLARDENGKLFDMTYDPGLTGFRRFRASAVQLDMVVNRAGWHDPQARINVATQLSDNYKGNERRGGEEPYYFRAHSGECIEFRHTNELPKDLELDDFQMKVPTDTIGQHIHLVKFDVTSADGSGNGWNYEDGTFAADELAARIKAAGRSPSGIDSSIAAQQPGEDTEEYQLRKQARDAWDLSCKPVVDNKKYLWKLKQSENPACFQTTVQRWFADPILSTTGEKSTEAAPKIDRTLRTVFTHDHFGPSNIQQHGFYSALLIEPPRMISQVYEPDPKKKYGAVTSATSTETPDWLVVKKTAAQFDCSAKRPKTPLNELQDHFSPFLAVKNKVAEFTANCDYIPAMVLADGDTAAVHSDTHAQRSEFGIGSRALVQKPKGESDVLHLNYREFALSIADFALLYDGKKMTENEVKALDDEKLDIEDRNGLDRLLYEAISSNTSAPKPHVCNWSKENDLKEAEISPADAVRCEVSRPETGVPATWLTQAATALAHHRKEIRLAHGKPVDAPERPEAISQRHHNPYLINYRNEPVPLRVGETTSGETVGKNAECPNEAIAPPSPNFHSTSVARQKAGDNGDMARAFRTKEHGDPCTPVLEAYSGERVVFRMIQGAQEVQHVFTVEGRTFRRNVDQNFEYGAWVTPNPDVKPGPRRWLECMKAGMVGRPRQNGYWFGRSGESGRNPEWLKRYRTLAANCDNIDGSVTAQEIGISEHFEFAGRFSSDSGGFAESTKSIVGNDQTVRTDSQGIRDSLYHYGSVDAIWNGAWGLFRTFADERIMDPSFNDTRKIGSRLRRLDGPEGGRAEAAIASDPANARKSAPLQSVPDAIVPKASPGLECPFLPETTDVSTNASLSSRLASFHQSPHAIAGVAAISARDADPTRKLKGIVYDPVTKLYDPDGLMLVPLSTQDLADVGITAPKIYGAERQSANADGSHNFGLRAADGSRIETKVKDIVKKRGFKPFVARANAGDCLHLVVINLLRNHPKEQDGANPSVKGLRDLPGDAWMPTITRLNVDQLKVSGDQEKLDGNIGELTPSASLSLSIPLSLMSNVNDTPDPVGLNPRYALEPWLKETAAPKVTVMTFFAGTIGFNASGLDNAISNVWFSAFDPNYDFEAEATQPTSFGDSPAIQSVRGIAPIGTKSCSFKEGANDYRYVIWPSDRRVCRDAGVDPKDVAVNVLGRRYCAAVESKQPITLKLPKRDELQICIAALVKHSVENDPDSELDLHVIPRAYGALPIKSTSDPISHGAHGLAGTLIVEAATSSYNGRDETAPASHMAVPAFDIIQGAGAITPAPLTKFSWRSVKLKRPTFEPNTTLTLKPSLTLSAVNGMDDYEQATISEASIKEASLLWQDGLNLWDGHRRAFYSKGCMLNRDGSGCVGNELIGGPIPDCAICDDSYDHGEKGVAYRSSALFARLRGLRVDYPVGKQVRLPFRLGPDRLNSLNNNPVYWAPDVEGHDATVDLNAWPIPDDVFIGSGRIIDPSLILEFSPSQEIALRIVEPQGRARQRAFVPVGFSYADIFPGFGSGHTSLIAPGKAVNAAMQAPDYPGDYVWFDGPRQILDGGAWGLFRVK